MLLEMANKDALMTALHAPPKQSGLRVCMVAYAFYESDTRILQYAAALAKRGDTVDVIALSVTTVCRNSKFSTASTSTGFSQNRE